MNSITRVVLGSMFIILSSPTPLYSGSSLVDERVGRSQTRPFSGKLLVHDPLTNTPDSTRQRPAPVLRIRGQTAGEDYQPKVTRLPDVSVTCSSTSFVLRVKKSFYGFSAVSEELTLGKTCKSNGVLEPHKDLLFTYALSSCQGEKQVFPHYVTYKYILHYVPQPHRNTRHRVNVGVECRYQRDVLKPTWQTPLRKIIRSRSGDFSIQLMDDSWSSPVRSAVFILGQKVNVQVSTRHHYPGVKLFITSCYAATVNTVSQTNKHSIIDNYGCLHESRINPGAAIFRFSRADNVVQFSFGAFQFIDFPEAQVSIHCELTVSGGGPSSVQKSCFYSHEDKRWISLFGPDSVCDCCESVCNPTKAKQITYEGSVSSDEALFSDHLTSPSDLNSTVIAHRNDDMVWFEAHLAKEPQTSYTSENYVASVILKSSEDDHEQRQHKSLSRIVELVEENEKHGDVEILMAVSGSFVEAKPVLDPSEEFEVSSLGWSGDRKLQDVTERLGYWPKKAQKDEGFLKTFFMVEESLNMDESALSDTQPLEVVSPSNISKVKNEEDDVKERLDFRLSSVFLAGSDQLVEQGVVRKFDLAQASDEYDFSDGV